MKNLIKRMYKGRPTLFIGNNKKPIGYDNWYGEQFPLENNEIGSISIIFYDINDAALKVGISDINDITQWNSFLDYGDYGGFFDFEYEAIEFESCVVDGNKLTLIPFNNDYSNIFGVNFYEFDSLGEIIISDIEISGVFLKDVYFEGLDVAKSINDYLLTLNLYGEEITYTTDIYEYPNTNFETTDLSAYNRLYINDSINLLNLDVDMPHLTRLNIDDCDNLNNIMFNSSPILNEISFNTIGINSFQPNIESLKIINIYNSPSITNFSLTGTPYLENLTLQNLGITNLDSLTLNNLTSCNINNSNTFTAFTNNDFPLLTSLQISNNNIEIFSGNSLDSLIFLQLQNNNITEFKNNFIPSATTLNLDDNLLINFDNNELEMLDSLNMSRNNLVTFNNNNLPFISYLVLDDNNISNFVADFPYLSQLYLQNNSLTSFTVNDLSSINTLVLSNNQLTSFSGTGLNALLSLSLASNQLTDFNSVDLNNLRYLYLANNQLTSFSGTGLSSIEFLEMSNNTNLTSFTGAGLDNVKTITFVNSGIVNFNATGLFFADNINLVNNNLNVSSVNHILAKLVEYNRNNGILSMIGGGNATPTGQGLLDITTLQNRGWTIQYNA